MVCVQCVHTFIRIVIINSNDLRDKGRIWIWTWIWITFWRKVHYLFAANQDFYLFDVVFGHPAGQVLIVGYNWCEWPNRLRSWTAKVLIIIVRFGWRRRQRRWLWSGSVKMFSRFCKTAPTTKASDRTVEKRQGCETEIVQDKQWCSRGDTGRKRKKERERMFVRAINFGWVAYLYMYNFQMGKCAFSAIRKFMEVLESSCSHQYTC